MDLGNIGGFRVPKKALFSGFQPFFGHFKGPEWCQTKIQGHATPAERSPMIAERICGFWFQGSFVQIMAHCAVMLSDDCKFTICCHKEICPSSGCINSNQVMGAEIY